MFKEIKQLFKNRYGKRILSEWVYTLDNTYTIIDYPAKYFGIIKKVAYDNKYPTISFRKDEELEICINDNNSIYKVEDYLKGRVFDERKEEIK